MPAPGRVLPEHRERGAGTVLLGMVCLLVCFTLVVALTLASAYLARHRAAAAADLSALAGVSRLDAGAASACTAARHVARANGARLLECSVTGGEVEVQVEVGLTGPAAVLTDPRRRARAGPGAQASGA